MNHKAAELLLVMAGRATLLSHLDEIYAHGKKHQANEASGQESLWGDEEEAHPSFEPEIFARFEQLCYANLDLLRDPPKPPPRETITRQTEEDRQYFRALLKRLP